jgi:predicted metal-dependent peptidase
MSRRLASQEDEFFRVFRYAAVAEAPYLATAIFNLKPVRTAGLATFAVDKRWRLYLDPVRFEGWGVEGCAAVLIHEVNHVLRHHTDRWERHGDGRNPKIWNIAADCEINDDLVSLKSIALPGEPAFPKSFELEDGQFAEFYYDALVRKVETAAVQNVPCPDCGGTGNATSEPSDNGGGDGSGGGSQDNEDDSTSGTSGGGGTEPHDEEGQHDNDLGSGGGDSGDDDPCPTCNGTGDIPGEEGCGSGAGGPARDYELGGTDPRAPGLDEVDAEIVIRQTAQDIINHDKTRGNVPAGLRRWADTIFEPPKVDWRRLLAGAIRAAVAHKTGQVDYSYKRPGRRRIPRVVTPSMQRPIPHVAVVVDTSGSMSNEDVRAALNEVAGISRRVGVRGDQLKILAVDAAVHGVAPVRNPRDIRIDGGGGTDMRVGIEHAETLNPRPDVIVVLTDGWTPWPDKAGRVRVIAGIIADERHMSDAIAQVPNHITAVDIPVGVGQVQTADI